MLLNYIDGVPGWCNYTHKLYRNGYKRLSIHPVNEILPVIKNSANALPEMCYEKRKIVLNGKQVNIKTPKLRLFGAKGCTCAECGLEGSYFALEINKIITKHTVWQLNLYGVDSANNEVMFTIDHVIPRSLGGADNFGNFQPMCELCNVLKGNNLLWRSEKFALPF